MNSAGLVTASYIAATILFILALGGLSNQETARRGNWYGIIGMTLALAATILGVVTQHYTLLIVMLLVGGSIGLVLARRVQMTQMPELVAILHSLVGLAAVLVGFANFMDHSTVLHGAEATIHDIETYLGVLIGAVTFSGSVIAFGKLSGRIGGKPRHLAASPHDADRAGLRRAHGHGDRRRRHAGGRIDAQQLLGLGRVGD